MAETKKAWAQRMREEAKSYPRKIERKRVVGASGQIRTVVTCESGCWHNSGSQARRCLDACSHVVLEHTDYEHVYGLLRKAKW